MKTTFDGDGVESSRREGGARQSNLIDVHVGARVRLRRMLLGVSQEKLGEQLGLTFQQIQKYEKGSNRIGASRLYELSRVLDVPVQYFYDDLPGDETARPCPSGFSEAHDTANFAGFLSTRESVELQRSFARITDGTVRRAIVDLVRSLAGTAVDVGVPSGNDG